MAYLNIENLSEKYGNLYVIKDFNLCVNKGDFVSIIGKFGVGKSTLLKIIAGIMPIQEGSIIVDGLAPKEALAQRMIGIKFQKSNLLPWRNVLNNLLLPLELSGINDNDRALELLELVDLKPISDLSISQISGGTEQLLSILRCLMLDPELLLLDEPFSSLDEITREGLYEKIKIIQTAKRKTVLMVTHSINEAIRLSDKIIVLSEKPTKVKKVFNAKKDKININEIKKCLR